MELRPEDNNDLSNDSRRLPSNALVLIHPDGLPLITDGLPLPLDPPSSGLVDVPAHSTEDLGGKVAYMIMMHRSKL